VRLRGILFDVGGVLHVPHDDPLKERAYIRKTLGVLRLAGIPAGIPVPRTGDGHTGSAAAALEQIIRNGMAEYRNYALTSLRELPPARIWAGYVLKSLDVSPERIEPWAETLCRLYEERRRLIPRPGVRRAVETLHTLGYRQGIVSNVTSASFTARRLRRYRIAPFMETFALSTCTGIRKPDPAIFRAALRELGLDAGECLYVGDQISRDLRGGRNAGMGAVVLFRPGPGETSDISPDAADLRPDLYIDSFDEIIPYIRSLYSQSI
jgi:HAD superfamily hydrolase (TIGR01662 family)